MSINIQFFYVCMSWNMVFSPLLSQVTVAGCTADVIPALSRWPLLRPFVLWRFPWVLFSKWKITGCGLLTLHGRGPGRDWICRDFLVGRGQLLPWPYDLDRKRVLEKKMVHCGIWSLVSGSPLGYALEHRRSIECDDDGHHFFRAGFVDMSLAGRCLSSPVGNAEISVPRR